MTSPTPLAGIKVVEFPHMVMGPTVGHILSGLGAEVVRVEPIGGDRTRRLIGSGAGYHPMYNRGKRSIALDIASAEGAAAARDLIATADVVIENFKVGGLKKYGLDYESLAEVNPRLIYCSITGFGQDGPYSHRAGYDYIIQGMSGLMSLTGQPDGEPLRAGVAITDLLTGLSA